MILNMFKLTNNVRHASWQKKKICDIFNGQVRESPLYSGILYFQSYIYIYTIMSEGCR